MSLFTFVSGLVLSLCHNVYMCGIVVVAILNIGDALIALLVIFLLRHISDLETYGRPKDREERKRCGEELQDALFLPLFQETLADR